MDSNCGSYLLLQINTAAGFELETIREQTKKLAQAPDTCKTDVCNAITNSDVRRAVCCTSEADFVGQSDCPIPGDESYASEIATGTLGFLVGKTLGGYNPKQGCDPNFGLPQPTFRITAAA